MLCSTTCRVHRSEARRGDRNQRWLDDGKRLRHVRAPDRHLLAAPSRWSSPKSAVARTEMTSTLSGSIGSAPARHPGPGVRRLQQLRSAETSERQRRYCELLITLACLKQSAIEGPSHSTGSSEPRAFSRPLLRSRGHARPQRRDLSGSARYRPMRDWRTRRCHCRWFRVHIATRGGSRGTAPCPGLGYPPRRRAPTLTSTRGGVTTTSSEKGSLRLSAMTLSS